MTKVFGGEFLNSNYFSSGKIQSDQFLLLTPFNLALKVVSYNPSHNLSDNPRFYRGTLL